MRFTAFSLVFLVLVAAAAHGAEWSLTPRLQESVLYDDNRRLTTRDHEAVWGNELRVGGEAKYATELTEAFFNPIFRQRRFSREKELLDRDDILLDAGFTHTGERTLLDVEAAIEYRGSITNDLLTTARTDVNVDARDRTLSATWTYAFDARNTLQLAGSYSDLDYERTRDTGLSDFRFSTVSIAGIHRLTARDQVSLTVFNSRFVQPRATTVINGVSTTSESETDTLGLQAGYTRNFTETLVGSLSAGARRSDSSSETVQSFGATTPINVGGSRVTASNARNRVDLTGDTIRVPAGSNLLVSGIFPFLAPDGTDFTAPPGTLLLVPPQAGVLVADSDETSTGLAINASIEQQLETMDWELTFSRTLTPQGDGDLTERDQLTLALDQRFSERLRGDLDARYFQDSSLDGGGQDEREFLRVAAGVRWRLSRFWSVSSRYQYRRNKRDSIGTAESNGLFVSLNYNGDKTAWSR